MTYVDDLYEPGDDREPEPCDWYPAPEPIDLNEAEQRLNRMKPIGDPIKGWSITRVQLDGEDVGALCDLIGKDVPALIAELREARRRIAEWEALPGREEFATTDQPGVLPDRYHPYRVTAGEALKAAEKGRQAWVRRLTVHPWEPVDSEAPF